MAPCNHKRYSGGNLRDINCVPNIWFYLCNLEIGNRCEYGTARTNKKNSEFLVVYFYKSNQNVSLC